MGICWTKSVHPNASNQIKSRQVNQTDIVTNDESPVHSTVKLDLNVFLNCHNETQVSEGGEADLHKHFAGCKKNPDHTNFIPITKFNTDKLPDGYTDHHLYKLIKATADLTVRVEVRMTSPKRPEFYPGTTTPYPFYDMRNKRTLRFGTGEIEVRKFTDGRGVDAAGEDVDFEGEKYFSDFDKSATTCPCTQCKHSDKPNNVWWEILVNTATHVVFDDIEAGHTSCRFFYDEQDSPVVTLDKVSVGYVSSGADLCGLKYLTCNSLGDKLYKAELYRNDLWSKVWSKSWNQIDSKLTFIVSHPHGCHKQVSFGHWVDNYKVSKIDENCDSTKLTYTTSTCPGSSGARVHCVASSNGHLHSGALDTGLNCSCEGPYRK